MSKNRLLSLIFLLIPIASFAYTSPGQPRGFVNDFADILNPTEERSIETQLVQLETSTGAEVSVVTVSSLGDETIETYAVQLFEEWGIGKEAEDNGLLILVAPNEREVRIEVGYGLEGAVTDLQSGNIIRQVMVPAFQSNDYASGISGAVLAISQIITNSPEAAQYSRPAGNQADDGSGVNFAALFFIVIFILNIFSRILGKTKSWWLGGVIGAAIGGIIGLVVQSLLVGGISVIILTILGLIFDYFVSKRPPGSDGHGGFWPIFFGGHGRGDTGGFGGFGGGMSGGGGASGRW